MQKKTIAIIMAVLLVTSLTGCKSPADREIERLTKCQKELNEELDNLCEQQYRFQKAWDEYKQAESMGKYLKKILSVNIPLYVRLRINTLKSRTATSKRKSTIMKSFVRFPLSVRLSTRTAIRSPSLTIVSSRLLSIRLLSIRLLSAPLCHSLSF